MSEPTTAPESVNVERSVDLDAPIDEVWQTLTDPGELTEWLGAEVSVDLQPGGVGRVVDPDGTVHQVLVTAVEPGQRLAWHWWEDGGDLSSVEITTVPLTPGTRVRVIETTTIEPAPWRAQACARASSLTASRWPTAFRDLSRSSRAGSYRLLVGHGTHP
jgi:uncharacterized protein YndB with AHSA1/START domain